MNKIRKSIDLYENKNESKSYLDYEFIIGESISVKSVKNKVVQIIQTILRKMKELYRKFTTKLLTIITSKRAIQYRFNVELTDKFTRLGDEVFQLANSSMNAEEAESKCEPKIKEMHNLKQKIINAKKNINDAAFLGGFGLDPRNVSGASRQLTSMKEVMNGVAGMLKKCIKLVSELEKKAIADRDNEFGKVYLIRAKLANKLYQLEFAFAQYALTNALLSPTADSIRKNQQARNKK